MADTTLETMADRDARKVLIDFTTLDWQWKHCTYRDISRALNDAAVPLALATVALASGNAIQSDPTKLFTNKMRVGNRLLFVKSSAPEYTGLYLEEKRRSKIGRNTVSRSANLVIDTDGLYRSIRTHDALYGNAILHPGMFDHIDADTATPLDLFGLSDQPAVDKPDPLAALRQYSTFESMEVRALTATLQSISGLLVSATENN